MKTRLYLLILILGSLFLLQACSPNQPYVYRGLPKEYNLAYQEIYGHCYDSVSYAVVALDLYSEGLTLDKNHRIKGTGYNLYLSDIFVPDSLLEPGDYHSLPLHANPEPFTFLAGRDYEGTPHGMYILNIADDKIQSIQVLDSGLMTYRNDSLLFTLYYRNAYGYRATYTCSHTGTLIPWRKK